jgi:hypothetical protein
LPCPKLTGCARRFKSATTKGYGAKQPDGKACGQTAIILSAQYFYDNQMYKPGSGGRFDPQQKETHYAIECPTRGRRLQIVKTDSP